MEHVCLSLKHPNKFISVVSLSQSKEANCLKVTTGIEKVVRQKQALGAHCLLT